MTTDHAAAFGPLTTPHIADACVRLRLPLRTAPPGLCPALPDGHVAGRALPARHAGSVDVFFEAYERAQPGDVLVIDNGGRLDEGCIGDLTVIEARAAGIVGVVVWGAHRDSAELAVLGTPVWSYGVFPIGPLAARERDPAALDSARLGNQVVTSDDVIFADRDGAVVVGLGDVHRVLERARDIAATEREQANLVRAGTTLREQFQFSEYLERRSTDPGYAFRDHLRHIDGAIEE